ncbi:sigma-70 family RNA polymerase sigma factor [uncultured Aquimarina sp.]|uniref:RNA polymerase sigma factor n=1 Tax=uncultured Aquimarina sp. TaxID=575652 RepID=UPI00261D978A|nr:sigma-70 family RNA polymerase sigma factor [uncultured Aquimarina sp.]
MSSEEDFIHIEKIRQGDFEALSYIVDKYKDMVYNIALKIVKNKIEAEDIAQESFIKVYQQIHTFKKESKFSTWLYTITYRTAIYGLRKNKINTQPIVNEDHEKLKSQNLSQQESLQYKDTQYFVKLAINSLPSIEGLLITLFYIDENSIEEIHDITGLSKSNIKIKLFRARKKLKKQLNGLLKDELKNIL